MTPGPNRLPGCWTDGDLPGNVRVGAGTLISGRHSFRRFQSRRASAITIGANCTMDGVHFDVGEDGCIAIGEYCYFTNALLLCELEVIIGSYVVMGWNATIADTDFHPIAPADRIADAISQSPLGKGKPRPPIAKRRVIIEDDVWIGPNATILKGVRIGSGALVDAGTMVTRDVAPGTHVRGNPAKVVHPTDT